MTLDYIWSMWDKLKIDSSIYIDIYTIYITQLSHVTFNANI